MTRNRFRFRVVCSEGDPAPDMWVLFRQRVGWVLLLGAGLALLCLPQHRRLFLDQAGSAWRGKTPEWFSAEAEPRRAERLQETLRRFPDEPALHVGGLLAGVLGGAQPDYPPEAKDRQGAIYDPSRIRDPRLEYLTALCERFPDDPPVLATTLRYTSQNGIRIARGEVERYFQDPRPRKGRSLAAAAVRRVEELAADGERLDPGNGYYPSLRAAAYFAARRDDEGLRELGRAAACADWRDHAPAEGQGARELLMRTYGDHGIWMRIGSWAAVILPHYSTLRGAARVALFHADQAKRRGDFEREHRIRRDVIQLGGLMARRSEVLVGRLVGGSIAEMGFALPSEQPDGASVREVPEAERATWRAAYVARLRREAPALAGAVDEERRLLTGRRDQAQGQAVADRWDEVLMPATRWDLAGITLLHLLGIVSLVAAGARLAAAVLARRPSAADEQPARAGHAWAVALLGGGLAAVGCWALLGSAGLGGYWLHAAIPGRLLLETNGDAQSGAAWGTMAWPVVVGLFLAACIVGLRRGRALAGTATALHGGARLLAGTLAAAYVVYLVLAVSALNQADRAMQQLIQAETRAPPAGGS